MKSPKFFFAIKELLDLHVDLISSLVVSLFMTLSIKLCGFLSYRSAATGCAHSTADLFLVLFSYVFLIYTLYIVIGQMTWIACPALSTPIGILLDKESGSQSSSIRTSSKPNSGL